MKTNYEMWMEDRILIETGETELTSDVLKSYQMNEIRKTIQTAMKSRFYGKLLENVQSLDIKDFDDFQKLPFTTSENIISNPKHFLCVSPITISRIVTISTSGTTGESKRIYFTENDLNATVEFFRYGMLNLVSPGQRVLIFMPGSSPLNIGKLLKKGLDRAGCEGIIYGPIYQSIDALEAIKTNQADCIVGLPIQVFSLAKLKNTDSRYTDLKLKSILLSADYVPETLRHTISTAFDCPVYTHYGMTEMGYGGGVECSALNGYHMRDVDLYTEIINPVTGEAVPDGTFGEVVFTTLGREGMPLIRYRTGDIAKILPNNCACSKVFKRMDYVQGRLSERFPLQNGSFLTIGMLDEILFQLDNVLDYRASIENRGDSILLHIVIKPVNQKIIINRNEIEAILGKNPLFASILENQNIILKFDGYLDDIEVSNGMVKRKLVKKQQGQGKIA